MKHVVSVSHDDVVANKTAFFAGQRNEPGKKSLAFMVILNDMTGHDELDAHRLKMS